MHKHVSNILILQLVMVIISFICKISIKIKSNADSYMSQLCDSNKLISNYSLCAYSHILSYYF